MSNNIKTRACIHESWGPRILVMGGIFIGHPTNKSVDIEDAATSAYTPLLAIIPACYKVLFLTDPVVFPVR